MLAKHAQQRLVLRHPDFAGDTVDTQCQLPTGLHNYELLPGSVRPTQRAMPAQIYERPIRSPSGHMSGTKFSILSSGADRPSDVRTRSRELGCQLKRKTTFASAVFINGSADARLSSCHNNGC